MFCDLTPDSLVDKACLNPEGGVEGLKIEMFMLL